MTDVEQEYFERPVPREYGGKWVAWDGERDEIIASCDTLEELVQVAPQLDDDEIEIAYQWIPPSHVRLVGATL